MGDYDGPERRRRRWPSWQSIVTLVAVALAAWSILGVERRNDEIGQLAVENARLGRENASRIREVAGLTQRIVIEGRRRRDQSCKQDEQRHLDNVKRLRRTYRFLRSPLAARQPDLTALAIAGLPEIEREARRDQAPAFCDEPGIGLKEPDPKVPPRRDFSRLLPRPQ